jgi:hypothetical protein
MWVCQWFTQGTPVFSTNKTDPNDITEILLKVALNTITLNPITYDTVDLNTR